MKDIVLGGGLDLVTPKAMVKPGYLEDCFNYEVGLYQGYQTSEGFERFDGRMSPSTRDIWDLVIPNTSITLAYTGRTGVLNAAAPEGVGLTFSPDGRYLYNENYTTDVVYQYYLSTPWDPSTLFYTGKSFSVAAQDTNVGALAFSADGSKMYMTGNSENIYQYTVVVPFDVSTASYASLLLDVTAGAPTTQGMWFKPDGTKVYVLGGGFVAQYTLGTAWAINTGTLTDTFSHGVSGSVTGLAFHPDGYLFYISEHTSQTITYFSCDTAWDLTTAAAVGKTVSVAAQNGQMRSIFVHPDGGRIYTLDLAGQDVFEYGLNPNINENLTWTLLDKSGDLGVVIDCSVGAENTTVRFAYWDLDDALPPGALVTGDVSGVTFREGLESTQYAGKTIDTSAQDTAPTGLFFRPTGLTMYLAGNTGNAIDQWTLSTAWDVSTATYATKTFSTAGQTTAPQGVALSSDGTKCYVLSATNIYQYTLSPAWDLAGGAYASKTLLFSAKEPDASGFTLSSDGTKVYIVGSQQTVFMYTMSTAWDISTATFTSSYVLEFYDGSWQDDTIEGIAFNSAGTTFYIPRYFTDINNYTDIYEFTCSTAWNIATAESAETRYRDENDDAVLDLFVHENSLFLLANVNDVFEYTLYPDAVFTSLLDSATDITDYQNQLAAAAEVLRSAITQVPGSGPVLGIKFHTDRIHAVRDYYHFQFVGGQIGELHEGQHVAIGDGNDLLTGGPSVYSDEGIVRSMEVDFGQWDNANTHGTILIEPVNTAFDLSNRLARGNTNNFVVGLAELHFTSGSTEPTRGQELKGATSTKSAWVYRVELQSGTWAAGDAAGVIYCFEINGEMTNGELVDRVSPVAANILTLTEALYGANQDLGVMHFAPEPKGAAMAGLYRSSRTGWEKVELGWMVRFTGGANEPTPVKFGADTSAAVVTASSWKTAGSLLEIGGWAASAGTQLNAIAASGGAYIYPSGWTGYASIEMAEGFLLLYNFGITIPVGARVVGVEIEITAKNTGAAADGSALILVQPCLYNSALEEGGKLPGVVTKRQSIGDLTVAFVAYTFGGANDLWGADIDADMVQDANFGLKFSMEWDAGTTYTAQQVDHVRMRVHYVEQGQRIYFYDTGAVADYTSARLVHLNVESGTWAGANAVGVLYLYDLYKGQIPTKNIQIRTAAAGGGSLIANMVGNELRMYLPGSIKTKAAESKYQMIAENAYARDDLAAIYGASGAGQAFSYDGHYARFVHSGLSPDLDKPRHLALFQFRLWLGYGFGEAAISTAGEPLVFDGSLNAVATGFGRGITGLMPLAGKTMGVYTDRSVYAVTVSGADFDQQVFAPRSGALEYTLQNIGQTAMYLDMRGIGSPHTTEKYGDFDIGRVSKLVQPWLLPRIQGRALGTLRGKLGAVATSVSRSKNQYRIYFADGYRLSVTTDDQGAQITRQFLYTDNDTSHYVKVLATEAEVDEKGQDRMFFTMDVNPDYDHGDALGYCYEEDRGLSYDGSAYKRWIELSAISGKNIHVNTVWGLLHFYGMSHGYAPLKMTTATDLEHPTDADDTTEDARYSLAFGASTNDATTELKAYFDKERTSRRGRHLSIRLQGESDRELPHLIQHIALDETQAREER